jgi:hypothetical protein
MPATCRRAVEPPVRYFRSGLPEQRPPFERVPHGGRDQPFYATFDFESADTVAGPAQQLSRRHLES